MRKATPWVIYLICCTRKVARKNNNNVPLQKTNWERNSNSYRVVHDKYISYMYTNKTGVRLSSKMIEFTQNN